MHVVSLWSLGCGYFEKLLNMLWVVVLAGAMWWGGVGTVEVSHGFRGELNPF